MLRRTFLTLLLLVSVTPAFAQQIDGVGGSALTVKENDNVPTVSSVNSISFTNGTVTDDGGGAGSIRIIIGEFVAGSFANLSETASSIAVSDTLRIAAIGTDLSAYKNGAFIASTTDASLTGGRPAICSYPATALTDGEISTFTAGRFSGIGGLLLNGAGQ